MKKSYNRLLVSSAIVYISIGLFTPAWYLFMAQSGGAGKFGLALGITAVAGGITAYFTGWLADAHHKPRLLFASYTVLAIITILYTLAGSSLWIFVLQLLYGVFGSITLLLENVMLSLYTTVEGRGKGMGFFAGVVKIGTGIAMMIGGGLVLAIGIIPTFVATGILLFGGGLIALTIAEKPKIIA